MGRSKASSFAIARAAARIPARPTRQTCFRPGRKSNGWQDGKTSGHSSFPKRDMPGVSAPDAALPCPASRWTAPCWSCRPVPSTARSAFGPMHISATATGRIGTRGWKPWKGFAAFPASHFFPGGRVSSRQTGKGIHDGQFSRACPGTVRVPRKNCPQPPKSAGQEAAGP